MLGRGRMSWCVLLSGLMVLGVGCGKSGPKVKTADVAGTVLLDGRPLADVTVVFVGKNSQFVGMGKTGPDGKYKLDTGSIPGKRGAMPGNNQVYFTTALDDASKGPPMVPPTETGMANPKGSPIPPKYSNPVQPALTFDVPEGGTPSADFQLSSK